MKNVVRLENHYSPGALERAVARFVTYYHYERLHEAIGNVTPDDMYPGPQRDIITRRKKIKRLTLERRKKENLRNAAWLKMGARILSKEMAESPKGFDDVHWTRMAMFPVPAFRVAFWPAEALGVKPLSFGPNMIDWLEIERLPGHSGQSRTITK